MPGALEEALGKNGDLSVWVATSSARTFTIPAVFKVTVAVKLGECILIAAIQLIRRGFRRQRGILVAHA